MLVRGTEEGTLIAPLPEPELEIGKAVVLTWPDFYEGWSLVSSPDMTDTWTPLDLPVLQRDGRNELVVPICGWRAAGCAAAKPTAPPTS